MIGQRQHFVPAPRIFVRNNSPESFKDRFDGEDFTILPGEYIEMPPEAAKLCFGWGEEDKSRAIRRLGWAETVNDLPEAARRLGLFSFHSSEEEAQRTGQAPARLEANAAPGSSTAEHAVESGAASDLSSRPVGGIDVLGKLGRAARQQAPA